MLAMDPIPQGAPELAPNPLLSWKSHTQASTKAIPAFKTVFQGKCLRKPADPELICFPRAEMFSPAWLGQPRRNHVPATCAEPGLLARGP